MKVGILGSGIVGKTLTGGFIKHGYEVMAGSRNPDKLKPWLTEFDGKLKIGDFAQTAAFGEIIVLATKGIVSHEVLKFAGIKNLSGKTILDATNPIADAEPVNGVLKFFTNLDDSLMERLQNLIPDANFVKVFNSVGAPFMVNPPFHPMPTMFICGNNESAKLEAVKILEKFGWEVEDMGKAEAARAIEPLCILWCIPGLRENRWTHAFKLLKI